jgi:RNA polymerase sigma-B factor
MSRDTHLAPETRLAEARELGEAERDAVISEVVREHMPLARSLAGRYRDRGESLEDLTQVAYLGLITAARQFRAGEGESFAAYAVPTIRGELRRYFRDKGWYVRPPRRLQETRSAVHQAEETLVHRLGRQPSDAEIGSYIGVDVTEVQESRVAAAGYSAVSLDAPAPGAGDSVGGGWTDVVPAELSGEDSLDVLVDTVSVQPLLRQLAPREQRILALRFYRGCTQQQIAEQVGVTQMQVSRLLSQSLGRLRSAFADSTAVDA